MSTDGDAILRYAQADRELDEKARPVLTQIIKEIEDHYGIRIARIPRDDRSVSQRQWMAERQLRHHAGATGRALTQSAAASVSHASGTPAV